MADLSDVSNMLVTLAAQTLYPNGTAQPSLIAAPVRLYPGWPTPNQLDQDLAVGTVHVNVFARPDEKPLVSTIRDWLPLSVSVATITASISGQSVTMGGTVSAPQNVALVADGKPYVYAVQSADTLTSIATALAALVAGDQTASSSGVVITVPNAHSLVARVGGTGTSIREIRRLRKTFQVGVWANTPALRDQAASALDVAVSVATRILLADGSTALFHDPHSIQMDDPQRVLLYRRDLLVPIDYSITQTQTTYDVLVQQTNIETANTPPVLIKTIYS